MASSSLLSDLSENFFLCSVCLEEFKEPKLLPCLHRYCRDCLKDIIQASSGGTFQCPICKNSCNIPKDVTDGFKTDFHMKSMLEFIRLQKSLDNEQCIECVSCSEKVKVNAYCFKCRAFLCHQCSCFHETNKMFEDHKQHILNMENTENKKFVLEKLTSPTQNPRCKHHVDQEALLCCGACGNIPVCLICVYGKHKGHDLHDVTKEAEHERESLKLKLMDINEHKDKLYNSLQMIDKAKKELKESAIKVSEGANLQYEQQVQKMKCKIELTKAETERNKETIRTKMEMEINETRRRHEEEIKELKHKYDKELNTADKNQTKSIKTMEKNLEKLESNFREWTAVKEENVKQKESELQGTSEYCEQIIKRYENFQATASSILASNDKWADLQCIPDIRAASELLVEELKEFPDLESLLNLKITKLCPALVDDVKIMYRDETVIDVEAILTCPLVISSVAAAGGDGNMVVTGSTSQGYSHITVINRDGRIRRQNKMKPAKCLYPWPNCCRLSELQVAIVIQPYEVGIYDVRDGSYNSKNIQGIIPECEMVTCVTTDPLKDHIMVGSCCRDVYVFDNQLNHIKTIQLSNVATNPGDIFVHEGTLFVCFSTKAYALTITGLKTHVMNEFPKPGIGEGNWKPFSVCTDNYGLIYILWKACVGGRVSCLLLRYSRDGQQILTQMTVDNNSSCMTTAEVEDAELLVVATRGTGKLYTYVLEPQ